MKKSFRKQLIVYMSSLVFAAIMMTYIVCCFSFDSVFEQRVAEDIYESVEEGKKNIDHFVDIVNEAATYLCGNVNISNILFSPASKNEVKQINDILLIQNEISNVYDMLLGDVNDRECSISLFADMNLPIAESIKFNREGNLRTSGVEFCLNTNVKDEIWYSETTKQKGKIICFKDKSADVVYFSKEIRSALNGNAIIGVVVLGVDERKLFDRMNLNDFDQPSCFFLLDKKGSVICKSGECFLPEHKMDKLSMSLGRNSNEVFFVDGYKIIASKSTLSKNVDLDIVAMIVPQSVGVDFGTMLRMIILGLVLFALLLFVINMISNKLNRPVGELAEVLKKVGTEEDASITVCHPCKINEFEVLYEAFDTMNATIQHLTQEKRLQGWREKETELKILQNQINRHYIYNALDTIACAALLNGVDEIADLITALSNNMKYSINLADTYVKVEEELEFISDYVQLQKRRCNSELELHYDVLDQIKEYSILKFIIQPLVENAIIHGEKPQGSRLIITVSIKMCGEDLQISVRDNGDSGNADEINKLLMDENMAEDGRLGIRNVRDRIRFKYGENYTLRYVKAEKGELEALVNIPYISVDNTN